MAESGKDAIYGLDIPLMRLVHVLRAAACSGRKGWGRRTTMTDLLLKKNSTDGAFAVRKRSLLAPLAAALVLAGGLAVLAAKRAGRRARVGHAA